MPYVGILGAQAEDRQMRLVFNFAIPVILFPMAIIVMPKTIDGRSVIVSTTFITSIMSPTRRLTQVILERRASAKKNPDGFGV